MKRSQKYCAVVEKAANAVLHYMHRGSICKTEDTYNKIIFTTQLKWSCIPSLKKKK